MMGLEKATESFSKLIEGPLAKVLSPETRETIYLRAFGLMKVPMLFFASPKVVELSAEQVTVKIPLTRKTKNHWNSMYFAALAAGADCAGGLLAMRQIHEEGNQVTLIFKDFHADFLKRAEGDVHFTCSEGIEIRDLVKKALATGERQNMPVHVVATVPSKLGTEPVANFVLTLSLKKSPKESLQKKKSSL